MLSFLFVGVQVSPVGPSHQKVVGERLPGYFLAKLLEKLVVFQTHDVSKFANGRYIMVGM